MRFIHTSDWHLGRSLHGEPLLDAQGTFLNWLLEQAIEHAVDAVVVAGDVYDRAVPQLDAVALLDRTLAAFAAARIRVIVTSGNHDSAVRLGFGGALNEYAGVHLRTSVADVDRPIVVTDAAGPVAVYGIPYLLPDAVMGPLQVTTRSHYAVLSAAMERIRSDAARRGAARYVVAAHAFVTGGTGSDSERDIRVGGIGDASVTAFDGASYVALGHLHQAQRVSSPEAPTTARYSGSPLAFSFSERDHHKSVTLVDIDAAGHAAVELLSTPVPRPLREVHGALGELRARASSDLTELAGAWVKVVLTDAVRPVAPMEKLRAIWPHTLVLDFAPDTVLTDAATDVARAARTVDPVEVCGLFVEWVAGAPADPAERAILREVVETATERVSRRHEVR